MKPIPFLKCILACATFSLVPALQAQTVVEIDQPTLEGWAESGAPVAVPSGVTYQVTLDGETTTLTPGTVFEVLDEEGAIRIVLVSSQPGTEPLDAGEMEGDNPAGDRQGPPEDRPADPQGKPPYDKLKPLPEEIVRENLNDISPS